jgi:hypothetical protein
MGEVKRPEPVPPGFLSTVIGTGTLITAWLFAVGWTYLHTYYRHFGVNINSLKFASSQYVVFAFAQFVSFPRARLLLGLLCLCVVLFVWWGASAKKPLWVALLAVIYLLLFWGGFLVAYAEAHEAALKDMRVGSSLPRIVIEMKKDNDSKFDLVDQIIRSADLRILIEDDDRLLVFVPQQLSGTTATVRVLDVRRQEVLYSVRATTVPIN